MFFQYHTSIARRHKWQQNHPRSPNRPSRRLLHPEFKVQQLVQIMALLKKAPSRLGLNQLRQKLLQLLQRKRLQKPFPAQALPKHQKLPLVARSLRLHPKRSHLQPQLRPHPKRFAMAEPVQPRNQRRVLHCPKSLPQRNVENKHPAPVDRQKASLFGVG